MPMTKAQGFDRTVHTTEDKFARGFLVDNVYDLLMAHDAKWSVRVALNGDWGSGKTSIAEMIDRRAREAGHAVGWLYPWRVNTNRDVALALTLTVLTALDDAHITLPAKRRVQKAVTGWLGFLKVFTGLHQAAGVGFSLLEDANAFDADFAAPIAQQLSEQGKRILIIIDDLDRCEPAFLAPLLLFMRTTLDIPGFSFLAPFDSDVVSKTLYVSNKAWTSADRFLEKVFDFRIPIPDLTVDQKTEFLGSQLAGTNLFVADSDVHACAALLPGTPRAIKALVRNVGTARSEIQRRSPEELRWPLLLLATMLRDTSLEFFRVYLRDVVDATGQEQWQRRTEQDRASDLNTIWEIVAHPDPATQRRVRQLVQALEGASEGIAQLRGVLHFTDEHEPVTDREFREFIAEWHQFGLTSALRQLPISRTSPMPEAAGYLASSAVTSYVRVLDDISHAATASQQEHRLSLEKAGRDYLAVATELLVRIGKARADQRFDLFVRLLVTERDSDRALPDTSELHRNAKKVLEQLCALAQDDWVRYDDCISDSLGLSEGQDDVTWKVDVSTTLRRQMKENARADLLRRLELTNGLDGIFRGHSAATQVGLMAHIFLDPSDEFWYETNAPALLAAASSQSVVRENAQAAIRGILDHVSVAGGNDPDWQIMRLHMESRPPYSVQGLIYAFLRSTTQLQTLWSASVNGSNGDAEIKDTRSKLIRLGVPAAVLATGPRDC